jgi:hypothetical protein
MIIFSILVSISQAIPVHAIPLPPCAFYGDVSVAGAPASSGLAISAEIDGVSYATTTVSAGKYGIDPWFTVPADDPDTPDKKEGGANGDIVIFKVGDVSADQFGVFQVGIRTNLNLTFPALPASPPAGGTGGGGGGSVPQPRPTPTPLLKLNLFGQASTLTMGSDGALPNAIQAVSGDGAVTLLIAKGTIALDRDGKPLEHLGAVVSSMRPAPPADAKIIGMAYDFSPSGAAFNPPLIMKFKYDPAEISTGADVNSLALAYFDTQAGKWVKLDSTVDTRELAVTASVKHFTTFAAILFGTTPRPAPSPASFSLTNLVIEPTQVKPSETVTITVTVTNLGELEGTYNLVLKVNGVDESSEKVTLDGGQSKVVSFSISCDEAGTYSLELDNLRGQFAVLTAPAVTPSPAPVSEATPSPSPAPPPAETPQEAAGISWVMFIGIGAAVIVVALIIFAIARRARTG